MTKLASRSLTSAAPTLVPIRPDWLMKPAAFMPRGFLNMPAAG